MLWKRILTVIVGAPFVIGAIFWPQTGLFKALVILSLTVALWEFFSIVGFDRRERFFGLFLGVFHISYLLFCPAWEGSLLSEIAFIVILLFLFFCLGKKQNLEGVADRIAQTLLGIFYIGTLGSFIGLTRDLSYGIFWVFLILAMTWLNDTFAYFLGHWLGKRFLAPLVSPKKTIEGLLGGFVGSFLGFFVFWIFLSNPLTLGDGVLLTAVVGVLGPLGDLSESLIKRSFHIKDSGQIIPGHGGMLDRIDALLFTSPVVYFLTNYL